MRQAHLAAPLALALLSTACGSGGGASTASGLVPTQREVADAVAASAAAHTDTDTDGDGLPDEVEARYQATLGTDPANPDSDGDGVADSVEVFGASWIWFQTRGKAGTAPGDAVANPASNAQAPHAADAVDTDKDGVADYLEFFGYRYDWSLARFVPDPAGVRTDPLQWSTDQDPYSDGQEVSGINMDVAVRAPGNHPLIPAYPDISVELLGYSVTLNEEVQYSQGGSLAKETSWSREVEHSSSLEVEVGTEVKVGASVSLEDLGCSMEVTSSFSIANTDTSTVAVAAGGSVTDEENWSTARTSNPTQAATLKLYVKVHNRGTAPASNVVPTLSLRIGGADVATFEPPELSVATLPPGGSFPPDDGVAWVIDSVSSGQKLYLTDWELRALESRAPISLSVAQKRADVMRFEDGKWVSVGDAGEYLTRILAMTTDLFADVGAGPDGVEGNVIHTRIASDDSPTAPRVTLQDALAWAANFRVEGDHYAIDLRNADGSVTPVPLTGRISEEGELLDDGEWRWQVDALTMASNWGAAPAAPELKDVLGMRLGPLSRIALRAPRRVDQAKPVIYTAWADASEDRAHVVACASDYDGVAAVYFQDERGVRTPLAQDGRGPYFYSGTVPGPLKGNGVERIVVESTRKVEGSSPPAPVTADGPVRVVFVRKAQPAIVEKVTYDPGSGRLYVNTWSPTSAVGAVQVFLGTSLYAELKAVDNLFEDPHGWQTTLSAWPDGLRVVVRTVDLLYTQRSLDDLDDFIPYQNGPLNLSADFDWTGTDSWTIPELDLERPAVSLYSFHTEQNSYGNPGTLMYYWKSHVTNGNPVGWDLARDGMADLYVTHGSCNPRLGFFFAGMKADVDGEVYYKSVTRKTIRQAQARFANGWIPSGGAQEARFDPYLNNVFFFLTPEGRLGKLLITGRSGDRTGWPYENCWVNLVGHYTVYNP